MDARWAPGPKDGVGTALAGASNVWFTIGRGVLNEVYYPQVDTPSIRDLGLIVTDGDTYFSDEATDSDCRIELTNGGIPAFRIENSSRDGTYKITKQIITDPERPVVLQRTAFETRNNAAYRLFVLLAPHLGDMGGGNDAWLDERGDTALLLAERDGVVLALAASAPLLKRSAGFVGISDGWQDLRRNKQLTATYQEARNGNTALCAEIDISSGDFTLALGFGRTADEATDNALQSLQQPFDDIQKRYVDGWQQWLDSCGAAFNPDDPALATISLTTIKTHESKNPGGGLVAGLASPWGYAAGDDAKIGYHVIWTRDMVETAGGLLAAGAHEGVNRLLHLLKNTQQTDGHWPQNMWIDGTPYWNGIQMDETALPILLVNLSLRESALSAEASLEFWPMVRLAASYILKNGPVTQQDRWEEDPGYTPFTVAAEIAALLAAADMADHAGEPGAATFMRETADTWYEHIDHWMYAQNTDWSKQFGIDGYYERIAPVKEDKIDRFDSRVQIKNVPASEAYLKPVHLVSPDALALVRFGLRSANDPRIRMTVQAIDALLKIETPYGTTWHRYNDDGYGEHADGSAFDGTGIGRGWPLLTGERAHYELALGHIEIAKKLKSDMESFAGRGGLLPEQVWDTEPIAAAGLSPGRPTGSAMPLIWAHGEYLKLLRSLKDGQLFDCPQQTVKRYLQDQTTTTLKAWRFNHKVRTLPPGKTLRIETLAPATVHWSADGWHTAADKATADSGLGVHYADLDTERLSGGQQVEFTFYWHHADTWEGRNFVVEVR